MGELRKFEMEVNEKIDNAKKETAKLDEKINSIKQGQLTSLQMVLSLQRRVREIEVQLGWADWHSLILITTLFIYCNIDYHCTKNS